MIRSDPL